MSFPATNRSHRVAVACAACVLAVSAAGALAGCAGAGQTDATDVAPAATDQIASPEATPVEIPGTFSEGGIRYFITSEEGAAEPTVTVGTGVQPADPQAVGDGLADPALTSVAVPATVEHEGVSYTVTQIAPYAFQYSGLVSVELPEGITKIGTCSFQFCRSLEAVRIPSTVTLISSLAFFADGSLATVEFAEDSHLKEFGDGAFAIRKTPGSTDNPDLTASLTSIELPASLNLLGSYTFYGQSQLQSVTFQGEKVNAIPPGVFGYCTSLERIDLPTITSTIERIGRNAFGNDTALRVVTFRDGVDGTQTTQAGNEFVGCTGIETVIYYGKRWNADNSGMNPGKDVSAGYYNVFGGDFTFGTGGFKDSPQVKEYYTVRQYASLEDAQAGTGATGYAVVLAGTPLTDVVAGTCDFLEEENFQTGGTWAFEGGASLSAGITDSLYLYPTDAHDLSSAVLAFETDARNEDGLPVVGLSALAGGLPLTLRDADGAALEPGVDFTYEILDEDGYLADEAALVAGTAYTAVAYGAGAYSGTTYAAFTLVDDAVTWARVAGEDALASSKAASKATFENASAATVPCDWALLASADPDRLAEALTGAGLAGALGADLLLTDPSELSQEASYEVNRVGAEKVAVLGGEASVSAGVLDAVSEMYVVEKSYRVSGVGAFELAEQVLRLGPSLGAAWGGTAVVCVAGDLAGALTASPWCYAQAAPLVWADAAAGLSDTALEALTAAGVGRAVVLGGADADAAAAQLEKAGLEVVRVAGTTDAEVNAAFAQFALDEGATLDGFVLADPARPELAVGAAALAGRAGSLVLFVEDAADVLAAARTDAGSTGVAHLWVAAPEDAVGPEAVERLLAAL